MGHRLLRNTVLAKKCWSVEVVKWWISKCTRYVIRTWHPLPNFIGSQEIIFRDLKIHSGCRNPRSTVHCPTSPMYTYTYLHARKTVLCPTKGLSNTESDISQNFDSENHNFFRFSQTQRNTSHYVLIKEAIATVRMFWNERTTKPCKIQQASHRPKSVYKENSQLRWNMYELHMFFANWDHHQRRRQAPAQRVEHFSRHYVYNHADR